jgi:hypothetical protein
MYVFTDFAADLLLAKQPSRCYWFFLLLFFLASPACSYKSNYAPVRKAHVNSITNAQYLAQENQAGAGKAFKKPESSKQHLPSEGKTQKRTLKKRVLLKNEWVNYNSLFSELSSYIHYDDRIISTGTAH